MSQSQLERRVPMAAGTDGESHPRSAPLALPVARRALAVLKQTRFGTAPPLAIALEQHSLAGSPSRRLPTGDHRSSPTNLPDAPQRPGYGFRRYSASRLAR